MRSHLVSPGLLLMVLLTASGAEFEEKLPDAEWKKLDTFESHTLAKAGQTFGKGQYRQAATEYDSFILEFPRSRAIPFALLRKGRCLQLDRKRFQAIEEYQEILDYFPNVVRFAAAALFYVGECHWQNGDAERAMKAWAEMATDEDYRKHVLAARALNSLAANLMKQENVRGAVKYYEQVVVDFKYSNRDARWAALPHVIRYYVRGAPDEKALRELYASAGTFEHSARKPPEDVVKDALYWQRVWESVVRYGAFDPLQADGRKRYYAYWAKQMEGRFPTWDDYQVQRINFQYNSEGNRQAWMQRLDKQFDAHQKPDGYGRIMKWIKLYAAFPEKIDAYYQKFDFDKMSNDQIIAAIRLFYVDVRNQKLARNLIDRLRFDDMSDQATAQFVRSLLWHYDGAMVESVCMRIDEAVYAKWEILEYFYWARYHNRTISADQKKRSVPLADELTKSDRYAKRAWWYKAEFLRMDRQHKDAIAAYRMADNPTQNLWRIVDCQLALVQIDQAIAQLREIENFFKNEAPRAALKVATIYRDRGDKKKYIAGLRAVLKKYPGSSESSTAHVELERLGVTRIDGGVDAQ